MDRVSLFRIKSEKSPDKPAFHLENKKRTWYNNKLYVNLIFYNGWRNPFGSYACNAK